MDFVMEVLFFSLWFMTFPFSAWFQPRRTQQELDDAINMRNKTRNQPGWTEARAL
jgi:hypothetical protein